MDESTIQQFVERFRARGDRFSRAYTCFHTIYTASQHIHDALYSISAGSRDPGRLDLAQRINVLDLPQDPGGVAHRVIDAALANDTERLLQALDEAGGRDSVAVFEQELRAAVEHWPELILDKGTESSYSDSHNDETQEYADEMVGDWRVVLPVGPFDLEGVHFQGFDIIVNIDRALEVSVFSSFPGDACPDSLGLLHPHVSGGGMCYGNMSGAITAARTSGMVHELLRITDDMLRRYNAPGAYRSLSNWAGYSEPSCVVCGDPLLGHLRHNRDHDDGWFRVERGAAHYGCAVYNSETDRYSIPESAGEPLGLGDCGRCGCSDNLRCIVVPSADGSRPYSVCDGCATLLQEEIEAAAEGRFICPSCRHVHTEDVTNARVTYAFNTDGTLSVACTRCRPPPIVVNGVRAYAGPTPLRRIAPYVVPRVQCTCGATQPENSLRRCEVTGEHICSACDPNETGLSEACFTDPAYLDAWLTMFMSSRCSEFTRAHMRVSSLYEMSLESAVSAIRRLAAAHISVVPDVRSLEDKCNIINNTAGMTLVEPIEEAAHDETVRQHREARPQASPEAESPF